MAAFRTFLRDRYRLAVLLVAIALAMKALVPAGTMIGTAPGTTVLTVLVCADTQGGSYEKQIVIPHSGKAQGDSGKKSESCPWSALGAAALSGADATLLALALGFILALGFRPAGPPPIRGHRYLRPPMRGPPAAA